MNKRGKNNGILIRVELLDEAVIRWYERQTERGKSQAVTDALKMGIPVVGEELDILKTVIDDLWASISSIEKWNEFVRAHLVAQGGAVEDVTRRMMEIDDILERAGEVIGQAEVE